ncbi:MAG: phage integrase N-terminal SAM-like domain-containing protein [Bryobacteraceae bacterium]
MRTLEDFAKHFHRPPDQLGPNEIRAYQVYLLQARKQGVGNHTAALGFFFCKTLKRNYRSRKCRIREHLAGCRSS